MFWATIFWLAWNTLEAIYWSLDPLRLLGLVITIFWETPRVMIPGTLQELARSLLLAFAANGDIDKLEDAIMLARIALALSPSWRLGGPHSSRPSMSDILGLCLSARFNRLGTMNDLDEAIALHTNAYELRPLCDVERSTSLTNLAICLFTRFTQMGAMTDLNKAVSLQRKGLEIQPHHHHLRLPSINSLAICLGVRFSHLEVMADLNEAIVLCRDALELCPIGDSFRHTVLNNLALCFHSRFVARGVLVDLNEAASLFHNAMELCPSAHPDRPGLLTGFAKSLSARFSQMGEIAELNEAIAILRNALKLCPGSHPRRSMVLHELGGCLSIRFGQQGLMVDLLEAITFVREAVQLRPDGHPDRPASLHSLASCLCDRFRQQGAIIDLEEGIALLRDSLRLFQGGGGERPTSLSQLAVCLTERHAHLGSASDLEEAIPLHREALEFRPEGHPNRSLSLANLALCLFLRFDGFGAMPDLEEAIALNRSALVLRPEGHPERSSSLANFGRCLSSRFLELGVITDLDDAMVFHRDALKLRQVGHPHRPVSLDHLGITLFTRFTQFGSMTDLDEAIASHRAALELLPHGHLERPLTLHSLSACLSARFNQLTVMGDLDEAISLLRDALNLYPPTHLERPSSLSNLSVCLFTRSRYLLLPTHLDEAIALEREALQHRLDGHPERWMSLNNLALSHFTRYQLVGQTSDLDEAITLYRDALDLGTHADRSMPLNNLALALCHRFRQLHAMDDLDEAIVLHRAALHLRSGSHPHRHGSISNLADSLFTRFVASRALGDLEEAFDLFSQLSDADLLHSASVGCLNAAKLWVTAAEVVQHPSILSAYRTCLQLLVNCIVTLPSLPQHLAILKGLTSSIAVDAFSACLRHGDLTGAVELLEQGRGVFWSQLLRLRSPIDDVIASGESGKEWAERFTQLTSLLRNILDSPPTSQHDQGLHLNLQLQDVVTQIRTLPGLSRFLLPSLFSDLSQAAIGGPVVIVNASVYGCDALIVPHDRDPIHIPLPITRSHVSRLASHLRDLTQLSKANDVTRDLVLVLRELWELVVYPIVKVIQVIHPHKSRIWWCPTAEFTILPLHAAGAYRKGGSNLSDLYVSSYTPTLTALIRARLQPDPTPKRDRFVVVGQAQAVGEQELVSVTMELANVTQRLAPIATVTRIEGCDAKVSRVTEALTNNEFVHLACHGILDRERPFESAFALGDGHLKIEDVMRYDMRHARFAFLSACHTTVGDEDSPDEAIHLAAAMQFAGFRSVVGTMWAVEDGDASRTTELFYDHLVGGAESERLDHTSAALALHRTMRSTDLARIPFDQRILFIHIGT